jgi:hypothetical protein
MDRGLAIYRDYRYNWRTIDTDAISQVHIGEDLLAVRNGQRRSPAPALGGIEGLEGRDHYSI